jgi:hypothetical protein
MTRYPLEIIKLIIIFEGLDLRYPEGYILDIKKKAKVMKWERHQHAANYFQDQYRILM